MAVKRYLIVKKLGIYDLLAYEENKFLKQREVYRDCKRMQSTTVLFVLLVSAVVIVVDDVRAWDAATITGK